MTEPDRKFEEEIRRALYAAGDLIVPAGDGLNKIRERAARRPPALGWLLAYATHLPRRLVRGGRVAASEVAATVHGHSSLGLVRASARHWPGKARHALRTPGIWLRPVLATATALVLVIGVTLSIPRLRHQVTAQLDSAFGNSSNQGPANSSGGSGAGNPQSSNSTRIDISATVTHMPGKPFLATMAPGSTQCRDQGSHGTSGTVANRQASGTLYMPPALGPQPPQVGPPSASVTCRSSTSPASRSTTLPDTSPTIVPYTSLTTPPTTPSTTPPATTPPPTTPPPTTPVTTPPTTTPPTSTPPSTTTSPATSTSSANGTQSTEPTDTATPGN